MPNYLTERDVQDYGSDLVNFAQRAAVHALSPHLQQIEQDNAALRQRLAVEARHRLDQQVEAAIPNWRDSTSTPTGTNGCSESTPCPESCDRIC